MNDEGKTDRLKPLLVVWAALLIGQILFACIAFALAPLGPDPSQYRLLVGMAIGFGIVATAAVMAMSIIPRRDADPKHAEANAIMRMAMLEGPSFFGIVAFILSGNRLALIGSLVAFLALISLRPRSDETARR